MRQRREPLQLVSNSAADRAGEAFRRWVAELDPGHEATIAEANETFELFGRDIVAYREMHAYPLTRVTVGVRSMVRTATGDDALRPAQRFKRLDRILRKLLRFHRMRLSQMEDIGSCRVVLPTLGDVYRVLARLRHNWPDVRERNVMDYIAEPKADGYRGIHVIHKRDGRLIEVQLRTRGQHEWAEAVEVYGPRLGHNLKDGEGPADLREYFRQAAERIARDERGERDEGAEDEFARLRERVLPYFQRNP